MHKTLSRASLIHVADPMCSWCYAFEPELTKVTTSTGLDVRLVMGGLYVGDRTVALDDNMRAYLRDTWQRVSELSGQAVEFGLIDWPEWTYDTGPACRAVVAMRTLAPESALDYFERLQNGFYVQNLDLTDTDVLFELAKSTKCDLERFATLLAEESLAHADYAEARALGATGFPLLLLDTGTDRIPVSTGFTRADRILRTIDVMS
jgi:putative protein-disulfide isomerase